MTDILKAVMTVVKIRLHILWIRITQIPDLLQIYFCCAVLSILYWGHPELKAKLNNKMEAKYGEPYGRLWGW